MNISGGLLYLGMPEVLDLDVAAVLDKMPAGRAREPQSPPPEHNVTTGGGERRPHAPQRRSLELERATSWRAMRRKAAVAREALQFFFLLCRSTNVSLFSCIALAYLARFDSSSSS